MVPEQTISCFLESIGCFGFNNLTIWKTVFNLFLKHLSIKQSVVSTKQSVVFHLVWKILFLLKDWECLCFGFNLEWITKLKQPQILTKTAQQQQAQPSLQHPSKGLDSSKLEHHKVQQSPPIWWRQIPGACVWSDWIWSSTCKTSIYTVQCFLQQQVRFLQN